MAINLWASADLCEYKQTRFAFLVQFAAASNFMMFGS